MAGRKKGFLFDQVHDVKAEDRASKTEGARHTSENGFSGPKLRLPLMPRGPESTTSHAFGRGSSSHRSHIILVFTSFIFQARLPPSNHTCSVKQAKKNLSRSPEYSIFSPLFTPSCKDLKTNNTGALGCVGKRTNTRQSAKVEINTWIWNMLLIEGNCEGGADALCDITKGCMQRATTKKHPRQSGKTDLEQGQRSLL